MSVDNGIYILKSLTKNSQPEFRVAHCSAIENIISGDEKRKNKYLIKYFGESEIFTNQLSALAEAQRIYDTIIKDSIVEYGIQNITLNEEFPKVP